jgi:hypothetical protein
MKQRTGGIEIKKQCYKGKENLFVFINTFLSSKRKTKGAGRGERECAIAEK